MRCLIVGAYGFLGSTLCDVLEHRGHEVLRAGRRDGVQVRVDPGDAVALTQVLEAHRPDVLINLVAMTNVDECERNPFTAFQVNAAIVEAIGTALRSVPLVHLIHLSTDQVYDGTGPHVETRTAPVNVYAITKLAGEMFAERLRATVLRVNFVGRSHSPSCTSLTDWLVESFQQGREITLFDDVFFSPLHVTSLSVAIERVVVQRLAGIFNLGARGGLSKAEFGMRLAKRLALSTAHVTIGSVNSAPLTARRPHDMVMDSSRFELAFGCNLSLIDDEIARVATDYSEMLRGLS